MTTPRTQIRSRPPSEPPSGRWADRDLVERVNELVPPPNDVIEWGNPLLSSTPVSLAIRELAERTVALEKAVQEIALDLQRLLAER